MPEPPNPLLDQAMAVTRELSVGIGPRRPAGTAELLAASSVSGRLRAHGLRAEIEEFPSWSTFGAPYGFIFSLAVGAGLLPRRRRLARAALAASAAALAALEGEFSHVSPLWRAAPHTSRNVVATIEPTEEAARTLCLVSHLDSSRSGLMFHPAVTPHLAPVVGAVGLATALQALEPLLSRSGPGRSLACASRGVLALAALLVAEREQRGEDVPGANDNATGDGACVALAAGLAKDPLTRTRVVILVTGSEESGVFGSRSFLRTHDTTGWLFLNFDGVGAPADLHFLRKEGGALRSWPADPRMVALAERLSTARPELRLSGTERSSGLPYDSTPILAHGGRALTLSAQNGSIPNYHWPTDTADRLDPEVFGRALSAAGELIAAIDRGEADL